jgi:fatty acid desaturase
MMPAMSEPRKLDYARPEPRKRLRFLQRLNPKATWHSVALAAVLSALIAAAAWWLLRLNPAWNPDWWVFALWEGAAVTIGGVGE